ncbi:hypothetical protein FA014_01925 [Cellulomonas hominis]|uniref:Uncharacterized protein n=1 Tax=Cellulomonas hominis TaxID=156981 RepID=A0A7Z8K1Q9_9CELL|nr:hypothetical protein [Cellulomonas hominis]TKR27138.1 hypothetical protein FA014_01925 [Cellulomonas hominis]
MPPFTSPSGEQVPDTDNPGVRAYYERRGYVSSTGAAQAESQPPQVPDGDPAESWTNAQIDAWAAREDVDLAGAKRKDEKLAVIAAAREAAGNDATGATGTVELGTGSTGAQDPSGA